jgi:hypothetical protein
LGGAALQRCDQGSVSAPALAAAVSLRVRFLRGCLGSDPQFRWRWLSTASALLLACAPALAIRASQDSVPAKTNKTASASSAAKKPIPARQSSSHPGGASHKASTPARTPGKSSSKGRHSNARGKKKIATRVRGQKQIDSDRAQAIQAALIREHYLSGEASGTWNQASEDAMRRYQGDRGWQTKTVPDSRALIKLGLGPSHDHLLNPESAMTTGPESAKSVPPAANRPPNPAPPAENADSPVPPQ